MIEVWSAVLLVLTCLLVPFLAIGSARRLGDGPLPLSRRGFFIQTVFVLAVLGGVAVCASLRTGVPLRLAPARFEAWLAAAALVLIGVAALYWRWPSRGRKAKDRLYSILPHGASELPWYLVVCLFAGVCEEIVYRGMLFSVLWYLSGSIVAAISIASVAFALAHAIQGWRGMLAIFVIALALHGLVLFSKSLLPAMVAHAVYDAVAGWLMPRWYERDGLAAATTAT